MRDATEEDGATFAGGILSIPVQVCPDRSARDAYMARLDIDTLFYPNDRLTAFGGDRGLSVFSIAEDMQAAVDRSGVHYHGFPDGVLGDGHYNQDGHRVVASLLAGGVCETISPPSITPG